MIIVVPRRTKSGEVRHGLYTQREKMDRNQRKLKASSFPLMKAE